MSQPIPNIQKLNTYKKYSTLSHQPRNCFSRYQVTQESYSRVLHLMRIIQFGTQTNSEIKMSQPIPNIQNLNAYKKYSTSSVPTQDCFYQILGTQESYSRVLHLMRIIQFGTRTNSEIKMSQPIPNIQNLNAYKKYSTSSGHQPRTASLDTRDLGKLFQGVTLNENTTVQNGL